MRKGIYVLNFKFDNNTPIYIQLVEQIKIHIISGYYGVGERLPSVRELAMETKVNPNTMQKALSELEDLGLIYTERTNGKFVTTDTDLILSYKKQYADQLSKNFLLSMKSIGYDDKQALEYLKEMKGDKQ